MAALVAEEIEMGSEQGIRIMAAGGGGEGKFGGEEAAVELGEFERNEPEADAAFPGFAEEDVEQTVNIGFEIGGFGEAFADLIFGHIIIANTNGEGADAGVFLADFGKEVIGHAAEGGGEVLFIREVNGEGFLVAERFLGLARRDEGAVVNAMRELADGGGLVAEDEFEQGKGSEGEVLDPGEAGGVEANAGFRADAGKPFVREGMQKGDFGAGLDDFKAGGFVDFGGNGADEFIGGNAFADGDFEALANGFANGLGNFNGRFAGAGNIEVAFVNGGLLNFRGEIVAIAEHPVGVLLVEFKIAGDDNEFGAEFAGAGGGHGGIDAKAPGFIGSGGDDAAFFAAHGNGFAAQFGIGGLFNGGKESIRIQMNNGTLAHGESALSDEHAEHALNDEFLTGNEVRVFGIFRLEERFASFQDEGFKGAFAINEGGDDLAVARFGGMLEDDDIVMANMAADHGIARNAEGESEAGGLKAEGGDIHDNTIRGFLLAIFAEAGGDGAEEGDFREGRAVEGFEVFSEAQGAGFAGLSNQNAFADKGLDVASGGERAVEPEFGSDFAVGGTGPGGSEFSGDKTANGFLLFAQADGTAHTAHLSSIKKSCQRAV